MITIFPCHEVVDVFAII